MSVVTPARAPRGYRRWLGFAAIVAPLAVLLVLQFRTLAELQETSAITHRVTLRGYAKAVLRAAEDLYRQKATAALDIPAGVLDQPNPGVLAAHFGAQDGQGVKRFFVMPFAVGVPGPVLLFDSGGRAVDGARDGAVIQAVRVASAPWRVLAEEGTEVESAPIAVDEQDSENRVILKPIVDDTSRVRGVAGLILDKAYFHGRYLPQLIESEMAPFPEQVRDNMVVTVGRRRDRDRAERSAAAPEGGFEVPFRFVFTDSALVIRSRSATPELWGQARFLTNVSLSVVLAGVLLAGIVMALRGAARATVLSQMKTEFVSSVSHELRTPLASIRVFGEFLRLGRVTDPQKIREYGEYIESESRRLTQLVNNILDFAKIESGQKRYRFAKADVGAIVAETLEAFAVRLKQDGFSVDVRTPQTPLPPAWVDAPAVAQVLTNLLDNAIKYSGDSRHLAVELGQSNGYVTVAVSDEGPGIEPEEQKRIFDEFYRVGTGLVHDTKGSGLGLSIVKHIVEAHHGTVEVRSRPGEGSTFTIQLPTHAA